jgi:predicted PurR-regulated permease PerM
VKIKTYRIVIHTVLYGYETSFLILREKHRLRVSVNQVLRRIFGPRGENVTECWKKVHNVIDNS